MLKIDQGMKPASENPDHRWVVMDEALQKRFDMRNGADRSNPDNFDM